MKPMMILILALSCIAFTSTDCKHSPTGPGDTTQVDTTSHIVQWMVDTLGTQGWIRDVWVFSKDSGLAVGQILINDSTGQLDLNHQRSIARWNGQRWQLQIIYDNNGQIIPDVRGIFAFSGTDVWLADGGVYHWNGSSSQMSDSYDRIALIGGVDNGQSINKLWGTSSNNVYGVGYKGFIAHYNGSNWSKMTSNTTCELDDIYGTDANHIWATGFNSVDGHCVVLQCNGSAWTTLYDNTGALPNQVQYFNTLWTDNTDYLYLDGGSYTQKLNLGNGTFQRTDSLSANEMFCIRGSTRNDIFRVGYGGETVHYNGVSWYKYPELTLLNNGYAWFYTVHPTKDFVVIGGLYLTELNSFPVVVRGYR